MLNRVPAVRRRQVTLVLITLSVELGDALAKWLSLTLPPWLLCVVCTGGWMGCLLGGVGCRRRGVLIRWLMQGMSILCLLVACILYGICREARAPSTGSAWLGQQVTARGSVTAVYAGKSWRYYRIHLTQIAIRDPSEKPGARAYHLCELDVDFRGGSTHGRNALSVGDQVTIRGMLVQASPTATKATTGANGHRMGAASGYAILGRVIAHHTGPAALSTRMRQWLLQQVRSTTNASLADGALVESIVFGGTQVDKSTTQDFQRAGLLHILAASGANVLLLTRTAEWMLRPLFVRLRLPTFIWYLLMFIGVWVFAVMCQLAPSIERATLMTSYRLVGTMVGRQPRLSTVTAVAGVVMAFAAPTTLASTSAILSFAATIAVARAVAGGGRRRQRRHRLSWMGHHLVDSIRITVWVELFVTPLVLVVFQQWSPFSVVANAGAEPLMIILLPMAAAALAAAACAGVCSVGVVQWLAQVLGTVSISLLHLLIWWAAFVAHWPHSLVTFQPPSLVWWTGYYALLLFGPGVVKHVKTLVRKRWAVSHLTEPSRMV